MSVEHYEKVFYVDHKSSSDVFIMALLELMKEKTFSEISISELCRKAGLSRNTFYKFFPGKSALLEYLKEDIALGYVEYKNNLTPGGMSAGMESFIHYFSFWYQLRDWVDVLVKNDLWEQIAMPEDREISLLSARDWDSYLADTPKAIEMMHMFLAAGCVQLVKWWSLNRYEKTPTQMAELVVYTLSGQALNTKTID